VYTCSAVLVASGLALVILVGCGVALFIRPSQAKPMMAAP
jgi:hypothetical protein